MNGYHLMTTEQKSNWDDLAERKTHSDTMRFTALDALHLAEYEALADRLKAEHAKNESDCEGVPADQFMAELPARLKAAETEAVRRCGLSDFLYEKLVQEAYASILDSAPESVKTRVEAILTERGFEHDFTPDEPGEGECPHTRIDIDCCPCGRHP